MKQSYWNQTLLLLTLSLASACGGSGSANNDNSGGQVGSEVFAGIVTTIAGTAGANGSTNGTGVNARFTFPSGTTSDGTNLYIADTNNNTIRKLVLSSGVVTTLAGTPSFSGGSADEPVLARASMEFTLWQQTGQIFM